MTIRRHDALADANEALRTVTPSEQWHLDHSGKASPIYDTTPRIQTPEGEAYLFDWKGTLSDRSVGLIKETRFTSVPAHVNQDMEVSYVYDGTCGFAVRDSYYVLGRGDAIIFDPGVVRSSPTYKEAGDIVISMVFRKEFFDMVFLSQLPGGGMLTTLLFEYISSRRRRDSYLVVHGTGNGRLEVLVALLFLELETPDAFSEIMTKSYTSSLFMELMRGLAHDSNTRIGQSTGGNDISRMLDHIEHNYRTCTLSSTAAEFGYSPSRLGALLKQATGQTFSEIRVAQQMIEAAYLLLNSNKTIVEVASEVGISNMDYFYRKFRSMYRMTPRAYRLTMSVDINGEPTR